MDQVPPKGDSRYRTHRSVKCYVAELVVGQLGATWYLNESAERVVHLFPGGIEKVVYKTSFYPLLPSTILPDWVKLHQMQGCTVTVGGKSLYPDQPNQAFATFPFIEVTSAKDRARFEAILAARS
jgi:hypothetical protein